MEYVVKQFAHNKIAEPLSYLINSSIEDGVFHNIFKP